MPALVGLYLAAALLLIVAGALKVRHPDPLVRALRSVRLPGGAMLVRVFGAAEVVLGLAALLPGGRPAAALMAVSYAVFTGFVVLALARDGVLSSCGCFGKVDCPPTRTHVAITARCAVVVATVAVQATSRSPSFPVSTDSPRSGASAYAGPGRQQGDDVPALVVVEGVAVVLLGVLVAGPLRSHAEILRALHELGASIDPDAARLWSGIASCTGRRASWGFRQPTSCLQPAAGCSTTSRAAWWCGRRQPARDSSGAPSWRSTVRCTGRRAF